MDAVAYCDTELIATVKSFIVPSVSHQWKFSCVIWTLGPLSSGQKIFYEKLLIFQNIKYILNITLVPITILWLVLNSFAVKNIC